MRRYVGSGGFSRVTLLPEMRAGALHLLDTRQASEGGGRCAGNNAPNGLEPEATPILHVHGASKEQVLELSLRLRPRCASRHASPLWSPQVSPMLRPKSPLLGPMSGFHRLHNVKACALDAEGKMGTEGAGRFVGDKRACERRLGAGMQMGCCGPVHKSIAINACAVRVEMGLDDMVALEVMASRLQSTIAAALPALQQKLGGEKRWGRVGSEGSSSGDLTASTMMLHHVRSVFVSCGVGAYVALSTGALAIGTLSIAAYVGLSCAL